ncbi:MAG: hypothetical protein M0C28_32170 [Candidatus Moduliflexus flocculans]|nr:hypothetical protein [Candidatus Moduliflexus flocculans]
MILGSGALKIGEAGEFDYSGQSSHQSPEGRKPRSRPHQPEHRHDPDLRNSWPIKSISCPSRLRLSKRSSPGKSPTESSSPSAARPP